MTDVNIAFASTGYGPLWSPVVSSWLRVMGYTSRYFEVNHVGKIGGAGITDRMYTMQAQNSLAQQIIDNPELTHLFMTESDMILPKDCIIKLLELDKDIASGLYFLRSDLPVARGQPCLYKKAVAIDVAKAKEVSQFRDYIHTPVRLFPTMNAFRVDCAGLGCVLIKRKVFETIPPPWFDLKAGGYGSDMYFYTHARKHGFELWVDPLVQCGQIDYYETDIRDYKWQLENNSDFAKMGFIIGMAGNGEALP